MPHVQTVFGVQQYNVAGSHVRDQRRLPNVVGRPSAGVAGGHRVQLRGHRVQLRGHVQKAHNASCMLSAATRLAASMMQSSSGCVTTTARRSDAGFAGQPAE